MTGENDENAYRMCEGILPASRPQLLPWLPIHSELYSQAPGSFSFWAHAGLCDRDCALLSLVHISAG